MESDACVDAKGADAEDEVAGEFVRDVKAGVEHEGTDCCGDGGAQSAREGGGEAREGRGRGGNTHEYEEGLEVEEATRSS